MSDSLHAPGRGKRASIPEPFYRYVPDYLDGVDADRLLEWLLHNVRWRAERVRLFGRSVVVPRLVAWYGEPGVGYRYSGLDHQAVGWPLRLRALVDSVRGSFAPGANFVLLNRYRDGADCIGWHADDERAIIAPVVSISLGAQRRFRLRISGSDAPVSLTLAHGSLLVHPAEWPHTLPKTRRPTGERINLSFRTVALP